MLTHDLLQALVEVTADHALHAGAVGADHVDHEFLTQDGLGKIFLLRNHLQQNAARNVGIVFLVDDDEFDPLETFEAQQGSAGSESNEQKLEREQVLQLIDDEIQKLPARQREAFLMRYWEDMDVAETAAAMGCSEGSVKTHCSRATHALAHALKAKGITL